MNKEFILKSDLLDILFQNRNKEYGAYTLRKFYPDRLKISLLVMFISAGLLSAFTFLPSGKKLTNDILTKEFVLGNAKVDVPPVPPKPKLPSEPSHRQTAKFINDIVIVKDSDSTEKLVDINKLEIGYKTIIDQPEGLEGTETGIVAGETSGVELATPKQLPNAKDAPIDNPDIQASFPGGQKELIRFLERNLHSPNDINEGETVQVQVKFVVDFDGALQSFDVVKDGGEDFNKEVVRVLKKMPKWNPGKKGGQNIPVYYTIPVKFTSNE